MIINSKSHEKGSWFYVLVSSHSLVLHSPRHLGVLQGRPAGPPGGDEGRASGQSPDAAAGGRPRQNHEAGAAEDDGEKVENRSRRLCTWVENPFFL